MKKHELCIGCSNVGNNELFGILTCNFEPFVNDDLVCPCISCLIKAICSVSCDSFVNFNTKKELECKKDTNNEEI